MAKWIFPFPDSQITGHYGTMSEYRRRNKMQPHSGTDWAAKAGTLIPAISDGTVKLIQFSSVLGWVVVQTAWDHKRRKTKYIGYCHLYCSYHGAKCGGPKTGCHTPLKKTKVGDKVKAGQKYLKVGNSGSATTGSHLHATIGNTVKSVFGATRSKQDLYKFIQEQTEFLAKEQANQEKKTVVFPEVKRCPTCKQPLARS